MELMNDVIKRSDAIKALCDAVDNKGNYEGEWLYTDEFCKTINSIPSADRPQGHWTKTDVATYRCSECGKIQIADDVNELNFCCCCGSHNKIRRLKGVSDDR